MIRKWSYIKSINQSPIIFFPHKNQFFFKIFRKTTRFKKNNKGFFTKFIRKLVIINKRRMGWNFYINISTFWVKNSLRYKKLLNYLQYILLYKFSINSPNLNFFFSKFKKLNIIDIKSIPINFNTLSTKGIMNVFFKKPLTTYCKTINIKSLRINPKVKHLTYFNSINYLNKTITLGFTFKNCFFMNKQYPINPTKYVNKFQFINILIKISLNCIVTLKLLNIYKIIYLIKLQ